MEGPTYLKDLLEQLELMLFKRKFDVDGSPLSNWETVASFHLKGVSEKKISAVGKLSPSELKRSLRLLQHFIVMNAKGQLGYVCERLLGIVEKLIGTQQNQQKKISKAIKPTTKDQPVTVEQLRDDTVEFFILETLLHAFEENVSRGESGIYDLVHNISPKVIQFCFDHLKFTYTSAIKFQATKCLGTLSKCHLNDICERFIKKLTSTKNEREYVPYQRAIVQLDFGVFDQDQTNTTINYLTKLQQAMEGINRGVLRQEVCTSLKPVLASFMRANDTKKARAWEAFNKNDPRAKDFIQTYSKIYQTVTKWAKKTKHTAFCYDLMQTMVFLGDISFYSKRSSELLHLLMNSLKDKNLRLPCLSFIEDFFKNIPQSYVEQDKESFNHMVKQLIPSLFPKKAATPANEAAVITNIWINIGKKLIQMAIVGVVQEVLKGNNYSNEQKAIALRVLGALAPSFKEEIAIFNKTLYPLVVQYIDNPKTEKILLRAVLKCFPHVEDPREEQRQQLPELISNLTLDTDREISSAALGALRDYMLLQPDQNLPFVLTLMTNILSNIKIDSEHLIKCFSNITIILTSYVDNIVESGKQLPIDLNKWLKVRENMEGVILLWLLHNETWVRNEAIRLLEVFNNPVFRAIENDKPNPPFLAEHILKKHSNESFDTWAPEISDLLQNNYEDHVKCIGCAFNYLYPKWNVISNNQQGNNPEVDQQISLWVNHLRFVCLAIRVPEPASELSTIITTEKIDKVIQDILELLHHESEDVRNVVISSLQQLHPSTYELLVNRVKNFELEREQKGKKQKKNKDDLSDYYTEREILDLFSRIISKMDQAVFASSQNIRNTFEEFLSVWLVKNQPVAKLQLQSKCYAATIIEKYQLNTANLKTDTPAAVEQTTNGKLYKLLISFLPLSTEPSEDEKRLEVCVVKAIAAVLYHGPLNDISLEEQILGFLPAILQRGPHLQEAAESAFGNFLSHNPHNLKRFIQSSYFAPEDAVTTTWALTNALLHAIVRNFTENMDVWLSLKQAEGLQVSAATMIHLALLHMCSPNPLARQYAIDLANGLANRGESPIDPGTHITATSHTSLPVYMESAVRYSRALASKYVALTSKLLHEVVIFGESLTQESADMAEQDKGFMLMLLTPWIYNVGHILDAKDNESVIVVRHILDDMLSFTRRCYLHTSLLVYLESFWCATVYNKTNATVPEVVHFLLSQFTESWMSGEKDVDKEGQALCKMICTFIARSDRGSIVLQQLTSKIHNYKEKVPLTAEEFIPWHKRRTTSMDNAHEHSAFQLLIDVVYEQDTMVLPYLALLLQNSLVLYGNNKETAIASDTMVSFLLHSVGFRHGEKAQRIDVLKFRDEFFPYPSMEAATSKRASDEQLKYVTQKIIDILSTHNPNLQVDWAHLSLQWSVQSTDIKIAVASLRLFSFLNKDYDYTILFLLAMNIYTSLKESNEEEKLKLLMKLFTEVPKNFPLDTKSIQLIVNVAISLLFTSSISQFAGALNILDSIFNIEKDVKLTLTEILGQSDVLWRSEKGKPDQDIVNSLLRGFTTIDTFNLTLRLFEVLTITHVKKLPLETNRILMLVLIMHALQVSLKVNNATLKAIEFIEQSGYKTGLSKIKDVFNKASDNHLEFLDKLFAAFSQVFSSMECFDFCLQTIIVVTKWGNFQWKIQLLQIMSAFVKNYPHNISKELFAEISAMIAHNSFSFDDDLVRACDSVFDLIIIKTGKKQPDEIYDFLQVPPSQDEVKSKTKVASPYFPGTKEEEFHHDFHKALTSLHTHILKLNEDAAAIINIKHEYKSAIIPQDPEDDDDDDEDEDDDDDKDDKNDKEDDDAHSDSGDEEYISEQKEEDSEKPDND